MNFRQIKETCIYFRDLELARSFYHEKLGLPIICYVETKHIFFRAGTSVLLCFNPDDSTLRLHLRAITLKVNIISHSKWLQLNMKSIRQKL
jgi:catechol 2,3-dioxygenase-like lactoylglutathione lyase family enzyme